jgi:hypothetical protein
MRILIALILPLLISHQGYGQDLSQQIIQNAMRRWQDTGTLIYLRAELSYSWAKEALIKGKLYGGDEETRMNKMVLTKADKKLVLQKLHSRRSTQWADSLFENS